MVVLSAVFLIAFAKADWSWIGGTQALNSPSSFQQLLVESPNNSPGGLAEASYLRNDSFIYSFGGFSRGFVFTNALLRYNIRNQMWAAISAPSSLIAEYGVKGVFSDLTYPMGKGGSAIFYDKLLNSLFVFGGASSLERTDNSLFEFNFDLMMWRWLHGTMNANDNGDYGELGVESPSNAPPSRGYSASFYDESPRILYIYGGWVSPNRVRGDQWMYSVNNNTWTWIHGSRTVNAAGIYGEFGEGTELTRPGARSTASHAFDETRRKFYFYGGIGTAERTSFGYPVDLWHYEPDSNIWTFLSGSRDHIQRSSYGVRGVSQNGTFPRSRFGGRMVIDQFSQKAYVFGGMVSFEQRSLLNDLWVLDLNSLIWTWIAGVSTFNAPGRYGTKDVSSPLNNPSARGWGIFFYLNETNQILLYGGVRVDLLADLWIYSVEDSTYSWLNETETAIEESTITSASTTRSTTTQRRPGIVVTRDNSTLSGQNIAMFIAVPLLGVGIIAVTIACVRSKRVKEFVQEVPVLRNTFYSLEMSMQNTTDAPITAAGSATEDITLSPTAMGLSVPAHLEVEELDFRCGKLLASGGGGEVYYGEATSPELLQRCRFIVVKRLKITNDLSLKLFEQEVSVMYLLSSSQFVAKIVGFMLKPGILIMKLYEDGSLMSYAAKHVLSRKWKLKFSCDIARGLLDIHRAQLAHCDIKPQNVLIDRDTNGRPLCVITDFGIAQVLSETLMIVKFSELVSVKGLSVKYAAPEVFKRFRNNLETATPEVMKASDVYALALTVFFILCENEPWNKQ